MAAPIILWNPTFAKESDDAGNRIIKTILPPPVSSTPRYRAYDPSESRLLTRLPRLASFCIRALSQYPEQLYQLEDIRLYYDRKEGGTDCVLQTVVPRWRRGDFSLLDVDPRLWASIIQIYRNPPSVFSSYPCQLSDPHVPLLNKVPCTPDFALLTVLDLARSTRVTDESILSLKSLHNLTALDLSGCSFVSSRAIEVLSRTLTFNDVGEKRGPWALRILRMRYNLKVDRKIFNFLHAFPLLSVVDLRDTQCTAADVTRPFFSASDDDSFNIFGLPLNEAVRCLSKTHRYMFASKRPFVLSLQDAPHPSAVEHAGSVPSRPNTVPPPSRHHNFVVLPPSRGSTMTGRVTSQSIQFGNIDANEILQKKAEQEGWERRRQEREEYFERYSEAWDYGDGLAGFGRDDDDGFDDDEYSSISSYESSDEDRDDSDLELLSVLRESMRTTDEARSTSPIGALEVARNLQAVEDRQVQRARVQTTALVEAFYRQRPDMSPRRSWLGTTSEKSYELALLRMPPDWNTLESIKADPEHVNKRRTSMRKQEISENASLLIRKWKAPMQLLQAELSKRRRPSRMNSVQNSTFVVNRGLSSPSSPTSTICDTGEVKVRNGPPLQPISNLRRPIRSSFAGQPRLKLDPVIKSVESASSSHSVRFSGVARRSRNMDLTEAFKLQAQKLSMSSFTGISIKTPTQKGGSSRVKLRQSAANRDRDKTSGRNGKRTKTTKTSVVGVNGFDWDSWGKR